MGCDEMHSSRSGHQKGLRHSLEHTGSSQRPDGSHISPLCVSMRRSNGPTGNHWFPLGGWEVVDFQCELLVRNQPMREDQLVHE